MTTDEALRLTMMQYRNTGGSGPTWDKFVATMRKQSSTDPEEVWLPTLKGLTRDLGKWLYADCEAEELVMVYDNDSPFGTGLARKIGVQTFGDLRRIQQQWDQEGR